MTTPLIDPQAFQALLHADRPVAITPQQVARLRAAGCEILDPSPGHFTLVRTSLSVWSDHLAAMHPLRWAPRIIEIYRQTGSTQDVIRRLIEEKGIEADGAMAVTDEQTAGRGRLGRSWHAPPGWSVLMSRAVICGPSLAATAETFALVAAVAVAKAIQRLLSPQNIAASAAASVGIKWPNDILIDGKKIAGILVETLPQHRAAIIGIGINVTHDPAHIPQEVRHRFGSLDMFGPRRDRLRVLDEVVRQLDACLDPQADVAALLADWRRMNIFSADRVVAFAQNGRTLRGRVLDVDAREGLIVRTLEGEIVHLPAATTSVVVEQV